MPVKVLMEGEENYDGHLGRASRRVLLVECDAGSNPLDEVGVPQLDAFLDQTLANGVKVRERAQVVCVVRNQSAGTDAYKISVAGDNQPLKAWSGRFALDEVKVPKFVRIPRHYVNAAGTLQTRNEWKDDSFTTRTHLQTLERTVDIGRLSPQQFFDLIAQNLDKTNTFHGKRWLFQPAEFNDLGADRMLVRYAWVHDPGTRAFVEDQQGPDRIAPDFRRPAFGEYEVVYSPLLGGRPFIRPIDYYPAGGPDDNPEGHTALPGNPLAE